jgi:hypothetical protein
LFSDIEFFQTFPRETMLINGMTSSTGSVSGLQPHEWTGGSPTEKMSTSGHTRGSSGDGQLISLGEPGIMKRTQSNSSLSDHSRCSITLFLHECLGTREPCNVYCRTSDIDLIQICTFICIMYSGDYASGMWQSSSTWE